MKTIHEHTVLVLNKNWQAINTTTPADALSALVSGNAKGLAIDDIHGMAPLDWEHWKELDVREDDRVIRTTQMTVRVPTIIVLGTYNKVPLKRLKFGFKGLWERDGGRCQYTGRRLTYDQANIDHIHPQSRGGATTWENCVLSDRDINQKKGAKTPKEAGLKLISRPYRPKSVPATYFIKNSHGITDWELFLPK